MSGKADRPGPVRLVASGLCAAVAVACGGHAGEASRAQTPVAVVDVAPPPADAGAPPTDAAPATRRNPLEPDASVQDVTATEYVVRGALVRGAQIVLLSVAPSAAQCGIREGDPGFVMAVSCAWSPGSHCVALTMTTHDGKFEKHHAALTVTAGALELDRGNGTNVHGDNVPVVTCP